MINADQIRAARALLRWPARKLAAASGVSPPTIQRMEGGQGVTASLARNVEAVEKALGDAGIVFIDENGGGYGVRLKERQPAK